MSASVAPNAVAAALSEARAHAEKGRLREAELAYRRVLDTAPDHVEALQFLGTRAIAGDQLAQAIEWFERAQASDPGNPELLTNLGLTYLASGHLDAARTKLASAVELAPESFITRLHLGVVQQQTGEDHAALISYFVAIRQAQANRRWLSSTPDVRRCSMRCWRHCTSGMEPTR
jgi:Flp pilus assembly protein TadD